MKFRDLLAWMLPLAALCAAPRLPAADWQSLESIRARAVAAVQTDARPGVTAVATPLDARLRLPACSGPLTAEIPGSSAAALSVAVGCASPAWTLYVPVRVSEPRKVLVLRRAVQRGETVSADLFDLQERDVAGLPQGYLSDPAEALGQRFRRPLAAGSVAGPSDLVPPDWVTRGGPVLLVGRAGGIEVRAEGKALASAGRGARVRVENSRSRRIVEGVVSAPGEVEVRL
jgi:flagella basal body P-ring formation protein FlgA